MSRIFVSKTLSGIVSLAAMSAARQAAEANENEIRYLQYSIDYDDALENAIGMLRIKKGPGVTNAVLRFFKSDDNRGLKGVDSTYFVQLYFTCKKLMHLEFSYFDDYMD